MASPYTLPASESWIIPSSGDESGINVTLALPIQRVTDAIQILVLLDGNSLFLTATEFARTVHSVTMGDLPPLAIVGLARDEPNMASYVASRFRDFTPQSWTLPGPFAQDNAMVTMGTGGGLRFLQFIEDNVLPQVKERLTTSGFQPGETSIGGWSLSGLFACWAWLERPEVFSHVLAISPSLWWDDASILARAFSPRPEGQRAFVCVGEHEEGDIEKVYPRRFANAEQRDLAAMVRNAAEFARLAEAAGADVESLSMPDEHHVTVQAVALARGLRHLYA